jgi:hypothetical protein
MTWCVRKGSSGKFRGGKFWERKGNWGFAGGGIWEGQGETKREQVYGVWREQQKTHAVCQEVIMGAEHYYGNASLQDLRVSRMLKVGSDTCVGTGK